MNGVIAPGVQRVAVNEPPQAKPDPFPDPAALDRLRCVDGAAGVKAAGTRQERGNKAVISCKDENDCSVTQPNHYLWRLP